MRIRDREYSQRKGFTEGTHRARSPAETVADFSRLMPRLGITRLANITGLDSIGLPVFIAVRPNSRSLSTSQGKGLDEASARASALMESIESWHAERIELPLRHESAHAMNEAGAPIVDVALLPLHQQGVLRLDVPILWVEGWDLLSDGPCWVPFECVSMNWVFPPGAMLTFASSSNGLASGNHLLEAAVHALCEAIERDALALFTLEDRARRKQRQIDLATVEDPACRRALELLDRAGVHAAAWDMTSESGIPACAALVCDRTIHPDEGALNAVTGYGCHLDPAVALLRALCEAVQSRVTLIAGSRDDFLHKDFIQSRNEDDQRKLLEDTLVPPPAARLPARSLAGETFEEDLAVLLSAVRKMGMQRAVLVDLTKSEIGVPVAKVIVPGLEGPTTLAACRPGRRVEEYRRRLAGSAP